MSFFRTKKKPIRLYLNCDELPIWNFSKLLNGDGYKWLVYKYDGGDYDESKLDQDLCKEIFEAIRNEWFSSQDDTDAIDIMILYAEIDHLVRRYDCIAAIINVLNSKMYTKDCLKIFVDELREWQYFTSLKTIEGDVEKLNSQHRSSKTTINRKKEELNQLLKKNKGKKQTLLQQKVKMQRILSMQMNLRTISVNEWLIIIKEVEEIIRSQNNGKRNNSIK